MKQLITVNVKIANKPMMMLYIHILLNYISNLSGMNTI